MITPHGNAVGSYTSFREILDDTRKQTWITGP